MSNSAHHANLMQTYYAAVEAWELQAEYETCGYATEMAEYKQLHPRPLFKDFLIAQRLHYFAY